MSCIALLVPTRERAQRFHRFALSVFETVSDADNIRIYVALDSDDPQLAEYLEFIKFFDTHITHIVIPKNGTTVFKYNALAKLAQEPILLWLSDNTISRTQHFDTYLLKWYETLLPHKIAVSGVNNLMPYVRDYAEYVLFTKAYQRLVDNIVNPDLIHFWSDTWICRVAQLAGVYHPIQNDVIMESMHAKVGKAVRDATFHRIRDTTIVAKGDRVWATSQKQRQADAQKILSHLAKYYCEDESDKTKN